MTIDEFKSLGLPVEDSAQLYVEAGLEWLRDNTTLKLNITDMESIKALPSSARLFLVRFSELSAQDINVASETMGPMSQSFVTGNWSARVGDLAKQLLKPYLKPNVRFIPCPQRWH